MEFRENWHIVVKTLEKIIPHYEEINKYLSLGYAEKARIYAVDSSYIDSDSLVLDAGIGPGTLSKIVVSRFNTNMLVGLDFSTNMLKTAAEKLAAFKRDDNKNNNIQLVRGIFAHLPFQDKTFDHVFASFSIKDSRDPNLSIREFHRVCKNNGWLTVIEIGKSDNRILRAAMSLYMRVSMPLFAKMLIRRKIKGNPWCLLAPTYKELPTNKSSRRHLQEVFGSASMREFLFGAIVVLRGQKNHRS